MMELPLASAMVMIPLAGALICGLFPGEKSPWIGMAASLLTFFCAGVLAYALWTGGPMTESLGGWGAPLGIELYVDGLAAILIVMTSLVGVATSLYSVGYFKGHYRGFYWSLWLVVWAAINGVFLSSDLFNIYVCLEVMGLGSVALIALAGPHALRAAMRYLLVTLCGSFFYLLGVALLYSRWGVLDLQILSTMVEPSLSADVALGVMILGLALKTALLPLHFWLPSAHANAPAPVSAVLSGLVVKASFVVILRLWHGVFGTLDKDDLVVVLAILGAIAIVWGSVQAVRQTRIKMLVAYSTIAQLGYLFLAMLPASREGGEAAWHGIGYFALSHGCAKGAMFLAAGAIAVSLGQDTFDEMRGRGLKLALPIIAFTLGGISLIGLPPSGGYIAKWLLLTGASATGMVWVAAVIQLGGLLAAAYVFKVVVYAFISPGEEREVESVGPIPWTMTAAALALAVAPIALGLIAIFPLELLDIGLPFGLGLPEGVEP